MAVNEFEKSMQEMMDAFGVRPSEAVWTNVEKDINERKRKRRILFLIVFSCLGICLAGYGIYQLTGATKSPISITDAGNKVDVAPTNSLDKTRAVDKEATTRKDVAVSAKISESTNEKRVATKIDDANTTVIISANKKTDKSGTQKTEVAATIEGSESKVSKVSAQKKIARIIGQSKARINSTTTISRQDNNNIPIAVPSNSETLDDNRQHTMSNKMGGVEHKGVSDVKTPAAPKGNIQTETTEQNDPLKKDTTTGYSVANDKQTAIQKSSKSIAAAQPHGRIAFGLHLSIGPSKFGKQLFTGGAGAMSTYSQFGNIGYPGTPGAYTITLQSKSKLAVAFEVGARARKQITKRSAISLGLDYAYMSDRIQTGTKKVTSLVSVVSLNVSTYYSASQQMGYTDRFHFLSLPFEYDWRITGNTHNFLSLNAGLALSTLLSTSALVYDTTAGGIYYHRKALFSTIGINFRPGISYHTHINGLDFNVGPQFSLGLNDFIKSEVDERRYVLYGGINMNLFFGKRPAH